MTSARLLAKSLLKTDSCADVQTFVTLASVCKCFHTILIKRKWFACTFKQYLIGLLTSRCLIYDLPYELREILLMSSARLQAKTLLKTDSCPDKQTFVTLASVCQHFHTILIKRKWFTRKLKQYITSMSLSHCLFHSLPNEVHEKVLMSSARRLATNLLKTDKRPDLQTFVTLASVCQLFHTITKHKWFARTLQRYLTAVCHPYQLCPQLLMIFDSQDRNVRGLTKLDDTLYVMYLGSNTIDVYTTQLPSAWLRGIFVKGLKQPGNIVACSINSCLYVADWAGVWRIKAGHVTEKWFSGKDVLSLSVTSEGSVVLLMDERNDEGGKLTRRGRVDIYSADGVQLLSLKLPRDIVEPHHVVQTVSETFVVCHGARNTKLERVCEVNSVGVMVKSYGGSCGSGLGQLNGPVHIALDKEERVFVADNNNHRVLLLDKQLNIQRVLLTWSLERPWRLFYDRNASQLVVGLTSGKVEIYSLL